ncbi:hypothetical protein [Microvirga arabica]|uniref:hypothetical protein n=1 Tax=Microvirga arabica TaxID=1128671 RepID=UPI00193A81D3|nr:hypothetical protein [Microvirga arabica]MBM1175389.1 hypothetical protein [Microvirga arabica]
MPGIARQFEPQITRSGGAPSKYRFVVRCSDCVSTDTYEASKPTSNETVKSYFDDRGWLLGRDRSYDLCPACLARPRRDGKPEDGRRRETADILARHLGKPEALAAKVFRPKEAAPPQPSPSRDLQQPNPAPALSPEVEQALSGMAADLKGLRAAVESMADQVGKLVALSGQQIEAIAGLAPALLQSTEGLSSGLRQIAHAIQTIQHLPLPPMDQPPAAETQASPRQTQLDDDAEPASLSEPEGQESLQRIRGKRQSRAEAGPITSAAIVVKSIADAKRSDRYYTSIRLPRALWDQSGFGPDDRLLLAWSGKALTIERATEGGVKPKSIGDTSVVLQSWKLGNLNLNQPKVAGADGSLRLTVGRRSSEA